MEEIFGALIRLDLVKKYPHKTGKSVRATKVSRIVRQLRKFSTYKREKPSMNDTAIVTRDEIRQTTWTMEDALAKRKQNI